MGAVGLLLTGSRCGPLEVVKQGSEPERVDIEVFPVDDRDAGADATDLGAEPQVGAPVRRDVRRTALATAIVGVLALLAGLLIGSSTADREITTIEATVPDTTEPVLDRLLPGDTMPSPTTTRPPRTTTTTTLAPKAVETVQIDERLVGTDLRLVGVEHHDGRLHLLELDLRDGTETRTDLGRRFEFEGVVAGGDWVVFMRMDGTQRLLRDGEFGEVAGLEELWDVRWQVGTDRFWRPDWSDGGWLGPSEWEEIDIAGQPTGRVLAVPRGAWAERADPRGGLIVGAEGQFYALDESGVTWIGAGQLIGVSADVSVMWSCDQQLSCGLVVTDRSTGESHELDPPAFDEGDGWIESMWGWELTGIEAISPDGEVCAVTLISDDEPALGLLDLRSGSTVELRSGTWWGSPMPAVVWSPDARFVFFVGEGDSEGLSAYDRTSGETFPVHAESSGWMAVTARPSRPL